VTVIASIARYHRKAGPDTSHENYASLRKPARRVVRIGAALLRIADGLDRTHVGVITSLRCRTGRDHVEIHLKGRGDAQLELWAAQNKRGLFEEEFGRTVGFEYAS
jgi:exopolyphosphatase/guanosine-5'-triphosphate,3'-diphosphate pyrophosphatase